jgi:hypothetical protein
MDGKTILTRSQKTAIQYINKYARKHKKESIKEINEILLMSNNSFNNYYTAMENIKKYARVAIHFHPDRPDKLLKTTIENLLEQGIYKNQFETHISSGGLSGYKGGERDKWEKYLFGGAYNGIFIKSSERPKYGALDLMHYPDGPSPRFGSCYFLLYPGVSQRCTFTYMGSHLKPRERGTLGEFDFILMKLLVDTFHYNNTFGEQNISVRNLLTRFNENLNVPIDNLSDKEAKRNLNHCIEAQVHGKISLKDDVEILVADPSFFKTNIGDIIIETCKKYSIKLLWHIGFEMKVDDVPDDFRGNKMPELAKRIAIDNTINAYILGLAIMDLYINPEKWDNWGSKDDIIQEIKLLWHVLVKYAGD